MAFIERKKQQLCNIIHNTHNQIYQPNVQLSTMSKRQTGLGQCASQAHDGVSCTLNVENNSLILLLFAIKITGAIILMK